VDEKMWGEEDRKEDRNKPDDKYEKDAPLQVWREGQEPVGGRRMGGVRKVATLQVLREDETLGGRG
jgi:hypothetical protein